jgi:hypothetical protein
VVDFNWCFLCFFGGDKRKDERTEWEMRRWVQSRTSLLSAGVGENLSPNEFFFEALPDDSPHKLQCLLGFSQPFQQMGNFAEEKPLLTRTLELMRQRWGAGALRLLKH